MDKEELKRLAGDPRFISGIYNYCDRWCERCAMTSRCLNYAMGEEESADPAARDMNNQAFWDKLGESFRLTLEMIRDTAEEMGINLDAMDPEEYREKEQLKDEMAESHECCRLAKAYGAMVNNWFDDVKELFREKEEGEGDEKDPEEGSLGDALQVVRWYQHQIYVKLLRAVRGQMEERFEDLDEFPKDSDGSAKVALIGMDRSIGAWGEIRRHMPTGKDKILEMIRHLIALRKKTEKAFLEARNFLRPGFDKIELNG
jgi:hypothetical protein